MTVAVGFLGYGVSLVLFVLALRGLGSARASAYFSVAPLVGVAVSLSVLGETVTWTFWVATALMGNGVWLHVTESHGHVHQHLPLEHSHSHVHDEHHQHEHGSESGDDKLHSHLHGHPLLSHRHAHYPDIHHQHTHR